MWISREKYESFFTELVAKDRQICDLREQVEELQIRNDCPYVYIRELQTELALMLDDLPIYSI